MRKPLHVGCGPKRIFQTTRGFNDGSWHEIRFDIYVNVQPDLIGAMTDMSAVQAGSMDAIFSSHNVEHLYPHEVPKAFSEFLRVLSGDGFAVITCPDLKSICPLIANDQLTEPAYHSPGGPISPLDVLFGHRASLKRGNIYMAHHVGFTRKVLHATLKSCGFQSVATWSREYAPFFDLWAIASKSMLDEQKLRELAVQHFQLPEIA